MDREELERLVAEIPSELKALVDADKRTNRDVVEAALWREFGGERVGALERRIEEKESRLNLVRREKKERDREETEIEEELDALRRKRDAVQKQKEKQNEEFESVKEKLSEVPRDPENQAIQTQAQKLGMTPEELIDELPPLDDGGDFQSL